MTKDEKCLQREVRRQLEFYFGEGNLPKDHFMQEQFCLNADEYISISVLLKFNKLRSLTESKSVIQDAVKKSKILTLTEDEEGVRRVAPLQDLKDVDTRTIYIANFPPDTDHASIKKQFTTYGKVLYVSLPKYKSSQDLRGFGFVEFETEEAAQAAVHALQPQSKEDRKEIAWKFFSLYNTQLTHVLRVAYDLDIDPQIEDRKNLQTREGEEPPPLAAISKKNWLRFRNKFRKWQNDKINTLKQEIDKALATMNVEPPALVNPDVDKLDKEAVGVTTSDLCIVEKSIVKINSEKLLSRRKIKEELKDFKEGIAYMDIADEELYCHIRCNSADVASEICARDWGSLKMTVLEGEEERQYWEKLNADRRKRKNMRQKRRKLKQGPPLSDSLPEPKKIHISHDILVTDKNLN